jgi:hypothetical protein
MATRKQSDDEQVDEQETSVDEQQDDDEMESNGSAPALSFQVDQDVMVIELPRDGNEAETLTRLAQFADGF